MNNGRIEDSHEHKDNETSLLDLMHALASIPNPDRAIALERILAFAQGAAAVSRAYVEGRDAS